MILTSLSRILREPAAIDPTGGVVTIDAPVPKQEVTSAPAAPATKQDNKKPQTPRNPTANELKHEFKVEDGDIDDLNVEQPAPQKKQEEKKVEAKKPEPVKEEKKEEVQGEIEDEQPLTNVIDLTKPIVPVGTQQKSRDYTGFSAEEVKVLKGMSNDSFTYTSKLIKENKELAGLKDASYLQHPNAYVLDPQYQQEQQNVQYFNQEAEYWQSQLELIGAGKEWSPLLGYNKEGKPVFDAPRAATKRDEEQVRMAMNAAFGAAQQANGKMQQFAGTYNQRIQHSNQAIMAELSKRCGWVADPKLLEEKIQIGDQQAPLKDVINDFKNMLPAHHRGGIMTEVASNLWAALMIYGHQIRMLQSTKQVAEKKQEEVYRAEPTSTDRPANNGKGKAINGVKEFSMEGVSL